MRVFLNKPFDTVIFVIIIIFSFCNCEKDNIVSSPIKDYTSDFDSVWTKFALEYPLFQYKKINWDEIYQKYNNQFTSISVEERNNILIDMLSIFKDAHIYLKTPDNKQIGQYIPANFTFNFNRQYIAHFIDSIAWHRESDYWGWSKLNNIGYIRFTDFHLGSVDSNAFDQVLDSLKTTDGIIIDIREIHGGNLNIIASIWNRFTKNKMTVGYQLYRNGPGYNDYAQLIPIITNPKDDWQYIKTVVVLTGQLCFSAGEIFAETMSHFTNVTLIGDTTFGGVEAPGLYELSDGTEYSVPIVAYLNSQKEPLEWKGVIPDIYILPSLVRNNTKKDIIIEEAINIIN